MKIYELIKSWENEKAEFKERFGVSIERIFERVGIAEKGTFYILKGSKD